MEKSIWEERVGEDAGTESLGSCDRVKRGVYTKKREGILIVERGKRGGIDICGRPIEEGVHPTL